MKPFAKSPLMNKRLASYGLKELTIPPRDPKIEDESVWSFIARRFDNSIADNLVDPIFKGTPLILKVSLVGKN
jgi:hypothetical protein